MQTTSEPTSTEPSIPPGSHLSPTRLDTPETADSTLLLERWLMPTTQRPALIAARGEGSWLWDSSGKRYLDFLQGWAVNSLGHSPVEIQQSLAEQARELLTPSPALHNAPQLFLAERLCTLTQYHQAAFASTGAEANEIAIKLARKWGQHRRNGAHVVLSTTNGFHGRTLATMAASGKPGFERLFPPRPAGFRQVPFDDLEAMHRAVDDDVCAILVEPVQGEGGVVVPSPGYLAGLRTLANASNLLFICDEVQTGCGRLGTLLGQERFGTRADVVTLGKGLGAGLPVSAVLINSRCIPLTPGEHGGTHAGAPLMMRAALRVLERISAPSLLDHVRRHEAILQDTLRGLCAELKGAQARGLGLLQALVFREPVAARLADACREQGLLVNAARPNILRFMPQLQVREAEIARMAELLRAAWRQLRTTA